MMTVSAIILLSCVVFCLGDSSIEPYDLRVEYLKNPLAIDISHPRLSWKLNGIIVNNTIPRNLSQTAYQVIAASSSSLLRESPDLWNTGKVNSSVQINIPYEGKLPGAGERVYWTVRVWDQLDEASSYVNESLWNVGHTRQWSAVWINGPIDLQKEGFNNLDLPDKLVISTHLGLKPVIYLRKTFSVDSKIRQAKVYATAKGLYKMSVNEELDVPLFAPGWTDYTQSIQYQVYDVTDLIHTNNTISVELGTGWFSGYVGFSNKFGYYGQKEAFLMELHMEFENGSKVIIGTDETWKVTTGPIVYSDLLQGELYYEERALNGWREYAYNDRNWHNVETSDVYSELVDIIADIGQPVVELEKRLPIHKKEVSRDVWIYDFGYNGAGYVEIELENFSSEVRVQVRHAEVLNPDGSLYTGNLRAARCIDTYVLNAERNRKAKLILKPHFTYRGFRYVEVSGIPAPLDNIRGIRIGIEGIENRVITDNKMVNTLLANIRSSHLSNFISVPTDCPQRNERLGWMADAQVFVHTAIYDGNIAPFMTKWMRDVREAQSRTTGSFSDVSPRLVDSFDGAPAWGDAGIIIPWHLYRMYADVRIIEENFEHMQLHFDYILNANPNFLWLASTNLNFGDWLAVEKTPKEVVSTAFFAYDALLLSKMAKILGKDTDADKYKKLHSDISSAFIKEYVSVSDGKIKGDTQTAYLLPVAFEMLPYDLRIKAVRNLVDNIKRNNWHLMTGFAGVGFLLPVLSDFGYNDVAYKILLQTTYPSWGYMIVNNATTMWEVWDNYVEKDGVKYPQISSFNHFALGSVGRWIYQYMAGIDTDETEVGFKKIVIKPHIGDGVNHTVAWYSAPQGPIGVEWTRLPNKLDLVVTLPVNTNAQIIVTIEGKTWIRHVSSGQYSYSIPIEA